MDRQAECHPERPYYAKDRCHNCYHRDLKAKDPERTKALKRASYYRNRPAALARGKAYYDANAQAIIKKARDWVLAHPGRPKARRLQAQYGVTPEMYRDALVGQAGRCLICLRVPDRDLVVDHDHATMVFRGLLCHHCNRALGHLRDDPRSARSAARYLEARAA